MLEAWWPAALAHAIEFAAGVLITLGCLKAALALLRGRGADAAGAEIADAVVAGMGWLTAAALLKLVGMSGWTPIGMFSSILALRTLLKRVMQHERRRFAASSRQVAGPAKG